MLKTGDYPKGGDEFSCCAGDERALTSGEIALTRSVFGDAIACDHVKIRRRKWAFFQPPSTTMAPCGHIHFHPKDLISYSDDFSKASLHLQGHFIHEMTHVWQVQTHGRFWLILRRMPWTKYAYSLRPEQPLTAYNVEQQAEIVKHAFWLRHGMKIAGACCREAYDLLVNFPGAVKA